MILRLVTAVGVAAAQNSGEAEPPEEPPDESPSDPPELLFELPLGGLLEVGLAVGEGVGDELTSGLALGSVDGFGEADGSGLVTGLADGVGLGVLAGDGETTGVGSVEGLGVALGSVEGLGETAGEGLVLGVGLGVLQRVGVGSTVQIVEPKAASVWLGKTTTTLITATKAKALSTKRLFKIYFDTFNNSREYPSFFMDLVVQKIDKKGQRQNTSDYSARVFFCMLKEVNMINRSSFYWYGLMMLLVFLADGMMSYMSPILIENRVNSTFLMGMVLSSSSVFGLVADMVISRFLVRREYQFFSRWLIGLALFFPLAFLLLPSKPIVLFLAMAIWGIYYEFITFSQYSFLAKSVSTHQHTFAWGLLGAFKSFGLVVAPLLATHLLAIHESIALGSVIGCLMLAALVFVVLKRSGKDVKASVQATPASSQKASGARSFATEIKLWTVLLRKIWPVYLFFFAFVLFETSIWTVGPLLMEELRHHHWLGGLLLSAYILPSFLAPLYAPLLGKIMGKKRTAFVAGIIGATIINAAAHFGNHSYWLLIGFFFGALFLSLDYPEIEAVFEDYVKRVEGYGNDLVGLRGTASSLAYIVGPLLAGFFTTQVGAGKSIGLFAMIFGLVAIVVAVVTPRKIRMPLQALKSV